MEFNNASLTFVDGFRRIGGARGAWPADSDLRPIKLIDATVLFESMVTRDRRTSGRPKSTGITDQGAE